MLTILWGIGKVFVVVDDDDLPLNTKEKLLIHSVTSVFQRCVVPVHVALWLCMSSVHSDRKFYHHCPLQSAHAP